MRWPFALFGGFVGFIAGAVLVQHVAQSNLQTLLFLFGGGIVGAAAGLRFRSVRHWVERGWKWRFAVGIVVGSAGGEFFYYLARLTRFDALSQGGSLFSWALTGAALGALVVLYLWFGFRNTDES